MHTGPIEKIIRQWESHTNILPVESVPVDSLLPAQSPRARGENAERIHILANSDTPLAPIIVHRGTMRVVDGMHRLRATVLRNEPTIDVRFIGGDEIDVFALTVRANVSHGMPLSLAERKAAAARLIRSHPHWSDRLIAMTAGLSHKTVGSLRDTVAGDGTVADKRVGRDGKKRPVDGGLGRARAAELIRADPRASLSSIARMAGVSVGTVRNVRAGMDDAGERQTADGAGGRSIRGVPAGDIGGGDAESTPRPSPERGVGVDIEPQTTTSIGPRHAVLIAQLRRDPSLRFSESGRTLLRLLSTSMTTVTECGRLGQTIPEHCVAGVVELSRETAQMWATLAQRLERRDDSGAISTGA